MIIHLYRQLFLFLWDYLGFFGAIVGISVIVSMICLPLYAIIGKMVAKENELQGELYPLIDELKRKYADDSASYQAALERLYKRYQYNPFLAIRKVLPLFVALPFLFLTYYMLEGTEQLNGVAFLCFKDVGKADGLLWGVNLLPFVMTGINLLTAFATPGLTNKDRNQAVFIALFFLVFLYTANAALMIYWCLNQFFNMLRSLYIDNWTGAKLLRERFFALCHLPLRAWSALVAFVSLGMCLGIRMVFTIRNGIFLLRNLLILEVFVFLPVMYAIFSSMPDRLDLDVETSHPMSIKAGFDFADEDGKTKVFDEQTQGCPLGKHIDPVSFYFGNGFGVDDLRLKFSRSENEYDFRSATFVKHLILRYGLHFEKGDDGHYAPKGASVFRGFEIPDVKFAHASVGAAQIGLLFLAFLGLFFGCAKAWQSCWKPSLALALMGALFFVVFLPGQTILANREVLNFPWFEIGMEMLVRGVAWSAVFFCMLQFTSVMFGRWPHLLFLAFLVYEYLQMAVLALGAPALDGNMDYYWHKTPQLVDFAVIVCLGVFILWKLRWLQKRIVGITFWLFAACVLSIMCAQFEHKASVSVSGVQSPWRSRRATVLKSIKYSPVKNVIVLVLDSVQSDATYDVISSNVNLRAEFEGFTAFNNHVGMHDNTFLGTVGMMTGEYFLDGMSEASFRTNAWGKGSFVSHYVDSNNPVYLMPGDFGAFSNRIPKEEPAQRRQVVRTVFSRRVKPMNFCLNDVLFLKTVPFFLKKWILQVIYLGSSSPDGTAAECAMYPELAEKDISSEQQTALLYIHSEGTHAPIRYDKDGNRIWTNKNNYKGLLGETHYLLKNVAAYLHVLKKRGLYDCSEIILVADHGCCFDTVKNPLLSKLHTRAVPFLWIKPIGSHGEMKSTDVPTSHARFHELLKQSRSKNLDIETIKQILKMPVRRFRLGRGKKLSDTYVDEHGETVKNEQGL